MTIFIGIMIGVFIYSFILTILTIYQDNSGYFMVEFLDVVMAGPCMWIFMLFLTIFRFFYKNFHKENKQKIKEYQKKDIKYIQKVAKKIVKKYRKSQYNADYIDFTKMQDYDSEGIEGYKCLIVHKAMNEHLNNKFESLMIHQKQDTIKELEKYFKKVTEEDMRKNGDSDYFINIHKTDIFYKLEAGN